MSNENPNRFNVSVFRVWYRKGEKGLYHVDIWREKPTQGYVSYEVETTRDGDLLIANCDDERIGDAIRAAVGLFLEDDDAN